MKDQMITNGRWVNNTDGTGIIFGIVMNDGSFAPIFNENNQTLEIMFNDDITHCQTQILKWILQNKNNRRL